MQTLCLQSSEKSFSDSLELENLPFMKLCASLPILYTSFMARIGMSTNFGHLVVQLVCLHQVDVHVGRIFYCVPCETKFASYLKVNISENFYWDLPWFFYAFIDFVFI